MSKVIFYKGLESQVESFMDSIKDDSTKANQFITFNMMMEQTKITLDSSVEEIISSLVTISSLINVTVFVPWMSMIRGSLKKYIDSNKIDLSYEVWEPEDDINIKHLSGETDEIYRTFPTDYTITYEDLVPKTETVLYLMPVRVATETLKNATQNSEFKIDVDTLRKLCNLDPKSRIGVSVPQLTVATWNEFFQMLEMAIASKQPVDKIYIEGNFNEEFIDRDEDDFFVTSIRRLNDNKIDCIWGKSLITIIESKAPSKDDEIPDVSNDVEVVKE